MCVDSREVATLETVLPWSSERVDSIRTGNAWLGYDLNAKTVTLKDTQLHYWQNLLIDACTFQYEIPRAEKLDRYSREGVALLMQCSLDVVVHLYCTNRAQNQYLGQWVVSEVRHDRAVASQVILKRLLHQKTHKSSQKRTRSASESRHYDCIRAQVPEDYVITHEPEGVSHLDAPVVVGGKWMGWVSEGYTVDYVVTSKDHLVRFCVESKYAAADVTEAAISKCKRLRDGQQTRVLLVYGHGDELRWIDFGASGSEPSSPTAEFPIRLP